MVGWVDANGNGTFEASEGTSIVIPSSSSTQTISLLWSGINVTLPQYSTTFMRLRIATVDQGMTTADMNGYFDNGEIEDYVVSVSLLLPDQNVTLKAQKLTSKKVSLVWNLNQENNNTAYELQRSDDGSSWQTINNRSTAGGSTPASYTYIDAEPQLPLSYYRVKVTKNSGAFEFSETKKIDFKQETLISLSPNPARSKAVLKIETTVAAIGHISVLDYTGRSTYETNVNLVNGTNEIDLPVVKKLSNGMYKVRLKINDEEFVTTLVIVK
ncbi:MAG: GEVED domain-containing protein [Ferruginibacter sp.]